MYKSLCCSYELLSGPLCTVGVPSCLLSGEGLDHTLPLPSPRVLVHLVPGPEHGAVLLLLHVLLTAGGLVLEQPYAAPWAMTIKYC